MENEKRIDELQEKLEELYTERKNIENEIFRQEEKFDIRELSETDIRYRGMVYLRERYSALDLEIQRIRKEIAQLREVKEDKAKSPLQQREQGLSSLEAEEKKISEAENLINQQRTGQNIGEE